MKELGIGQLAKRGGVGIDTVRYYERNGLLAPRTRLASGYRRYGEFELARLRFIRRAQTLGFTLKEISQLLALSAQRDVARIKRRRKQSSWTFNRVSQPLNASGTDLRHSLRRAPAMVERRTARSCAR